MEKASSGQLESAEKSQKSTLSSGKHEPLVQSFLIGLLCIGCLAAALHQEHGEVRRERLSGKLPHH